MQRNGESVNFKRALQNDDVFVANSVVKLTDLTGIPTIKGIQNAIISGGDLVNVVSNQYAHLPNEKFFGEVERKLIDDDINYITRSINRNNGSFAVDYILQDENFEISVKNGMDKIRPMLRFTNSYDGSCKTSGHFGFFREVCSNGLHIAQQQIGFSVKHKGDIATFVLPQIKSLVNVFMDNEYYTLTRKFERLSEQVIYDVPTAIKQIADTTKLFKFESSDVNPEPSLNARLVQEFILRESRELNEQPNKWLLYNAFNELTHTKLKKTFENQRRIDNQIFELVSAF